MFTYIRPCELRDQGMLKMKYNKNIGLGNDDFNFFPKNMLVQSQVKTKHYNNDK